MSNDISWWFACAYWIRAFGTFFLFSFVVGNCRAFICSILIRLFQLRLCVGFPAHKWIPIEFIHIDVTCFACVVLRLTFIGRPTILHPRVIVCVRVSVFVLLNRLAIYSHAYLCTRDFVSLLRLYVILVHSRIITTRMVCMCVTDICIRFVVVSHFLCRRLLLLLWRYRKRRIVHLDRK